MGFYDFILKYDFSNASVEQLIKCYSSHSGDKPSMYFLLVIYNYLAKYYWFNANIRVITNYSSM